MRRAEGRAYDRMPSVWVAISPGTWGPWNLRSFALLASCFPPGNRAKRWVVQFEAARASEGVKKFKATD